MPLIAAIYCFFIGLFLVLLSFIFQLSPGWKELFLIVTVLSYGFVISAPPLFTPFPDKIYRIDGRCNEILPHHNLILSVSNQNYYLSHFYTDTIYMPGDSLHFNARILPFRQNANPGEFSYARYLKQKNVFFHLLPVSPIRQNGHSDDLYTVFDHLRKKWLSKTHRLFSDSTCCQLVNALCLGYKNDLDSEVQNLFISTGTVHLLSVSGLHTGAIYLFILFIFKSIGFPSRKITFVVLPILWCYVCLTGLSPSVVRAATILSFIHIGQYFNRSYTPLNSVAAAAFLTLSFHPSNLYSLSFLLSYSAYTGILTIYPFLYRFAGKLPPFSGQNICLLLYYSSSSIADSSHQRLLFPYDQFERLLSQPGRGSISYFSALCRHALSDIPLSTQSVPGLDSGSDRKNNHGISAYLRSLQFQPASLVSLCSHRFIVLYQFDFSISLFYQTREKMEKIFHVHSLYSLMLEYILPFLSCQSPGNHRISTSSKKCYYTEL